MWGKRLALSLGTTVVALLLVEVALRLLGIEPARWVQPRHLERPDKRFGLDTYPDDPRGAFELDLRDPATLALWIDRGVPGVEQAARHRPHAVGLEYDEHLCRGASVGAPEPDVIRVVMIGDSFTEGQGVAQRHTFSAVLDRELGESVEVINCGRRGHDFPMIHQFFQRQLELQPEVVVYAMTLNDAQQSESFRARQAYLDDWIMNRRRMITAGSDPTPSFWTPRIAALIQDRLEGLRVGRETSRWYREMYDEPNRAGWEATQRQVRQMHDAMESRGGRFLVALLPLLIGLDGDDPFREVNQTIAEAFARTPPVELVDTTPAFLNQRAESLWVHPADRHPNERAHRIIAESIRPELERLIDELDRGHP